MQDLVADPDLKVKFSLRFDDFTASPLPDTLDAYLGYRERSIEFIESRNRRIAAHVGAGAADELACSNRGPDRLMRDHTPRRGVTPRAYRPAPPGIAAYTVKYEAGKGSPA